MVGISDNESRDTKLVGLCAGGIQESKRSIAPLLRVVGRQELLEAGASVKIILKRDVRRQVGAGVKSTRSLSIIETCGESMLEHPVGAGFWCIEALGCAVAGVVDAVLEEQVDLGYDARDYRRSRSQYYLFCMEFEEYQDWVRRSAHVLEGKHLKICRAAR